MLDDRPYMRSGRFGPPMTATVVLLLVNAGVFLVQQFIEHYTRFPLARYFALSWEGVAQGYLWQFFTFQFLHGGLIHILLNSWIIYVFGRAIEEALGRSHFLRLYFLSGVLGGLFQVGLSLLLPRLGGPVVGASAGAFGLVAAFAALYPERPLTILLAFIIPVSMRAKFLLLFSVALAVFGILFPGDNIAHAAHLGGIVGGLLYIRAILRTSEDSPMSWRSPRPAELVHAPTFKPLWSRAKKASTEELPPAEFISREVDPILDKISEQGIQSLTDRERRILEAARAKMARR